MLTITCIVALSGMPLWANLPPPVERVEVRDGNVFVNGERASGRLRRMRECEPKCPNQIPIQEQLQMVRERFS